MSPRSSSIRDARALTLVTNQSERRFLERRLREVKRSNE